MSDGMPHDLDVTAGTPSPANRTAREGLAEALVIFFQSTIQTTPIERSNGTSVPIPIPAEAIAENLHTVRETVRQAIAAFVRMERASGMPPEQVIVVLKQITIDASDLATGSRSTRSTRNDIVRWAIEAYFATPEQG